MNTLQSSPQIAIMPGHPCFDEEAHDRVWRVHLAVAPRCNIQCRFCERKVCAHLAAQHPGWARKVLTPDEAVALVRELAREHPGERFVVGVAGPGEPLANDETFAALVAVGSEFPHLALCLSTNGLLLEEELPRLLALGVGSLTVTINAADAAVGERVYAWVRYRGRTYRGREAAELLLERQVAGIRAALASGVALKANAVLVPGANDEHLPELARLLGGLGVRLMNVMPLIPSGTMRDYRAPTCEEVRRVRAECERWLPQFRRCQHCRADVVAMPAHHRAVMPASVGTTAEGDWRPVV